MLKDRNESLILLHQPKKNMLFTQKTSGLRNNANPVGMCAARGGGICYDFSTSVALNGQRSRYLIDNNIPAGQAVKHADIGLTL
jgi:hypothetical protein